MTSHENMKSTPQVMFATSLEFHLHNQGERICSLHANQLQKSLHHYRQQQQLYKSQPQQHHEHHYQQHRTQFWQQKHCCQQYLFKMNHHNHQLIYYPPHETSNSTYDTTRSASSEAIVKINNKNYLNVTDSNDNVTVFDSFDHTHNHVIHKMLKSLTTTFPPMKMILTMTMLMLLLTSPHFASSTNQPQRHRHSVPVMKPPFLLTQSSSSSSSSSSQSSSSSLLSTSLRSLKAPPSFSSSNDYSSKPTFQHYVFNTNNKLALAAFTSAFNSNSSNNSNNNNSKWNTSMLKPNTQVHVIKVYPKPFPSNKLPTTHLHHHHHHHHHHRHSNLQISENMKSEPANQMLNNWFKNLSRISNYQELKRPPYSYLNIPQQTKFDKNTKSGINIQNGKISNLGGDIVNNYETRGSSGSVERRSKLQSTYNIHGTGNYQNVFSHGWSGDYEENLNHVDEVSGSSERYIYGGGSGNVDGIRPVSTSVNYNSWIELQNKLLERLKFEVNMTSTPTCSRDSIERRVSEADAIFTGTIRKLVKGSKHRYQENQKAKRSFKYDNDVENMHSYSRNKYVYSTGYYNNYDNFNKFPTKESPDFKLQHYDILINNNVDNNNDDDYHDVVKIEVKRVLKGEEILKKHYFADQSLNTGFLRDLPKNYVTVYGLNNPSICDTYVRHQDTRIFSVIQNRDGRLEVAFSNEKLSLSNLQIFDELIAQELSNTHDKTTAKKPTWTTTTTKTTTKITTTKTKTTTTTKKATTTRTIRTTTTTTKTIATTTSTTKFWFWTTRQATTIPTTRTTTTRTSSVRRTTTPKPEEARLMIRLLSPTRQIISHESSAVFLCGAHIMPTSNNAVSTIPHFLIPNIHWYLNNNEHLLDNDDGSIQIWQKEGDVNSKMSVLRLTGDYVRRDGNIECRASTDQWIKYIGEPWTRHKGVLTKKSLTRLTVHKDTNEIRGFPKLHMEPPSGDVLALLGRHLQLKCEGHARPAPTIIWLKNGVEPIDNTTDPRYVLLYPGLIHIENVRNEDAGLFECRANNTFGTNVGHINLQVTNEACDLVHCKFGAKCISQYGETRCECIEKCDNEKLNLLCSDEGITYKNYCDVELKQCKRQKAINIAYRGRCATEHKDPCEEVKCYHGSVCVVGADGLTTCQCQITCSDDIKKQICGSDGRSYKNECYLRKRVCEERRDIFVKFYGPCDPCDEVKCYYGSVCVNGFCKCQFTCLDDDDGRKKVCGNDGRSYKNECHLKKHACEVQKNIQVKFHGPCNPCENVNCHHGSVCVDGSCQCQFTCSDDGEGRKKVCGSDGRSYKNECHLKKHACEERRDISVKSYGPCDSCEDIRCHYGSVCMNGSCQCQFTCPDDDVDGRKKVCGNDGRSYENECQMKKHACEVQKNIQVKFLGPCDQCENVRCHYGSVCVNGSCQCQFTCPDDNDVRKKVCGNDGKSYKNDCYLKKHACEVQKNIQIKFQGPCDKCEDVKCHYGSVCVVGLCKCQFNCHDDGGNKKVCGSDGRSYIDKCHLQKHACEEKKDISVRFFGPCDPCEDVTCHYGSVCVTGSCKCQFTCSDDYGDIGRKICGSDGRSYKNECYLKKHACDIQKNIWIKSHGQCDPCEDVKCYHGAVCVVGADGSTLCQCQFICPDDDGRKKVCGSDGRSYKNECHLKKYACEERRDLFVKSYGPCDACEDVKCHHGSVCVAGADGSSACQCQFICSDADDRKKKVCGSDGRSYKNECHLKKYACEEKRDISVKSYGPCDPCEDVMCHYGSICVAGSCICQFNCPDDDGRKKICGSDGITYKNECHLKKHICGVQRNIQIKFYRPCDLCEDVKCHHGSVCVDGSCQCQFTCPDDDDGKKKVCGSDGRSYKNECHLKKHACEERRDIPIKSYGPCNPCEEIECHYGSVCVNGSCKCQFTCPDDDDDGGRKKVCGNDGRSYKNECHLKKHACEVQKNIRVKFHGPCDPCENVKCHYESVCVNGSCQCQFTCADDDDGRKNVCGNDGKSYKNECHLKRHACEVQKNIQVKFHGPCDPCEKVRCHFGSACVNGSCQCQFTCPDDNDGRKKVCGSDGKSYKNECHLKKHACEVQKNIQINFQGPCDKCEDIRCHHGSVCVDGSCQCQFTCSDDKDGRKKVCGSDGRSYKNECHLKKHACEVQKNIQINFEGPCDQCEEIRCHYGSVCVDGSCQCQFTCPDDDNGMKKVCGNDGRSYKNECHLKKHACEERRDISVRFHGLCDPCYDHKCPRNKQCRLDDHRLPRCDCDESCSTGGGSPVCASDGQTYANECFLKLHACVSNYDVRVIHGGYCDADSNPCARNDTCPPFQQCVVDSKNTPRCLCATKCPQVLRPVCASNGVTYDNDCEMKRLTCIESKNVHKLYEGKCDQAYSCKSTVCDRGGVCSLKEGHITECVCPTCPPHLKQVCGSNMVTYINKCLLRRDSCLNNVDIHVQHQGPCDMCRGVQCGDYETCNNSTGICECITSCSSDDTTEVCASNGMTYPSECDMKMMSCKSRIELSVIHLGRCDKCLGVVCYYGAECVDGRCKCEAHCDPTTDASTIFLCDRTTQTTYTHCTLKHAECLKQARIEVDPGSCDSHSTTTTIKMTTTTTTSTTTTSTTTTMTPDEDGSGSGSGYDGDDEGGDDGEGESSGFDNNGSIDGGSGDYNGGDNHGDDDDDNYDENEYQNSKSKVRKKLSRKRRREGKCSKDTCKFGGRCGVNSEGKYTCICQFECGALRSPVCGSDRQTYANECEMKEFSCINQVAISLDRKGDCADIVEDFCDGSQPMINQSSNQLIDCSDEHQCPEPGYCHFIGSVGRCCVADSVEYSCLSSAHGCCSDGFTPAAGPNQSGCPDKCKCNKLGSFNTSCHPVTLQCFCRPHVIGIQCDRCNANYWGMQNIQLSNEGCLPCQCNQYGSKRLDCDQNNGNCLCLNGIMGTKCDLCSNGKKLSKYGCVGDDRSRRSRPCPSDVHCRFGARCQMALHGPECVCNDVCAPDDKHAFAGVCGSDNQWYASKCRLEMAACRKQIDIRVLYSGPCDDGGVVDTPVKKKIEKTRVHDDDAQHVYPSFSPNSWMKLFKPQFGISELNLNFELKPYNNNGIIFYLGRNEDGDDDEEEDDDGDGVDDEFMSLMLNNGYFEFRYNLGKGPMTLKSVERIRVNHWYRVSVTKLQTVLILKINNQLPYNKREPSTLQPINSIRTAYLGYPPHFSSRKRIGQDSGINGCIKSFTMNSSRLFVDYKLHDERGATEVKKRHLIGECKQSACSKFPCEHGGQCNDINEGLSFRCVCKEGYSGTNCQTERVYSPTACDSDPCLNGGTCESGIGGSFQCICRPGYSGIKCQITGFIYVH